MKATFKEKILLKLGYKYVANTSTKEIHLLTDPICHATFYLAKKNRKYVNRRQMIKMIKSGEYNGCRFCLTEHDNG